MISVLTHYLTEFSDAPFTTPVPETPAALKSSELEAIAMIRDLINVRIRPMLHDDGGDVQYQGFDPKSGVYEIG